MNNLLIHKIHLINEEEKRQMKNEKASLRLDYWCNDEQGFIFLSHRTNL